MRPEILINEFGKKIGIEPLSFNGNNEIRLVIGDRVIDLFYNKDKGIVLFASQIANILVNETSYIFANLLELNLAYALTGGGTIGFDRNENKLHYVSFVSLKGISVEAFEAFVSASLNAVNFLAQAVNSREISDRPMSFSAKNAAPESEITSTLKV